MVRDWRRVRTVYTQPCVLILITSMYRFGSLTSTSRILSLWTVSHCCCYFFLLFIYFFFICCLLFTVVTVTCLISQFFFPLFLCISTSVLNFITMNGKSLFIFTVFFFFYLLSLLPVWFHCFFFPLFWYVFTSVS